MPPSDGAARSAIDHRPVARKPDAAAGPAWSSGPSRIGGRRASTCACRRPPRWYAEGSAGLWRNPELELGLRWRRDNRPTPAWGRRHDESFDRAMAFLDRSEQEHTARRGGAGAGAEAEASAGAVDRGGVRRAVSRRRVSGVRGTAGESPGDGESPAGQGRRGPDACRRPASTRRAPAPTCRRWRSSGASCSKRPRCSTSTSSSRMPATKRCATRWRMAHLRLGHIDRWLEKADDAAHEYRARRSGCSRAWDEQFRQGGIPSGSRQRLQLARVDADADSRPRRRCREGLQQRARAAGGSRAREPGACRVSAGRRRGRGTTAGSCVSRTADPGSPEFSAAESDFREAIRLLEPLARQPVGSRARRSSWRARTTISRVCWRSTTTRLVEARGCTKPPSGATRS